MISQPKKFELSTGKKKLFLMLIGIGVASFAYALKTDPTRAWANYLTDYFYWMNISMAGLFFAALQHATNSQWSATIRRIGEVFIAYIPVSFVLFLGLLFGLHHLFEWSEASAVAHDHLLQVKSAYLNIPFFLVRHVALYVLMGTIGYKMVKNSLKQDEAPDPSLTLKNITLSSPFLALFAVLYTLASIDLIMSLSPHWFSTIFGVYCWAGLFFSGLAMIMFWTVTLRKKNVLSNFVTDDHLHDLGKLMFAFLVFWAYSAFSQYMLIWYANLPEETPYFILRTIGAYKPVSMALLLGKFLIPFFMLLTRPAKRSANWLLFMTVWFFAAQWIDVYWMVFPTFFKEPVFGLTEIGMFVGFLGLFFLSVSTYLAKVSPVAINDPWIEEALHYHNNPNAY